METKKCILSSLVLFSVLIPTLFMLVEVEARALKPPSDLDSGGYICSGYTEHEFGDRNKGTRVWYYIPDELKNGDSAPVVVMLHGMILLAPDIYEAHIEHLCKQGYIVIFPQFQRGGIGGLLHDLMLDPDQNDHLERAIDATNLALSMIGAKADASKITLYGHSLGGLISLCWSADAWIPNSIVLANPSIDSTSGMPSFISWLINIVELDWKSKIGAITCPVVLLTGNDDDIAPPSQVIEIYDALSAANSKTVYQLQTDKYGRPDLLADHMACICDDGWIPSWMMNMLGGDGEVDATDRLFYWKALDEVLKGQTSVDFDMGEWSDGTPVKPVIQLKP